MKKHGFDFTGEEYSKQEEGKITVINKPAGSSNKSIDAEDVDFEEIKE
jgi:hypothetical protein